MGGSVPGKVIAFNQVLIGFTVSVLVMMTLAADNIEIRNYRLCLTFFQEREGVVMSQKLFSRANVLVTCM